MDAPASKAGPLEALQANPFGPQSQWSSLLCEREYLQDEILRGEKYLHQLRGDVATGYTLLEAWVGSERQTRDALHEETRSAGAINDALEQSLQGWLERLQQRLEAVSRDIDILPPQGSQQLAGPEESIFNLLRAAG